MSNAVMTSAWGQYKQYVEEDRLAKLSFSDWFLPYTAGYVKSFESDAFQSGCAYAGKNVYREIYSHTDTEDSTQVWLRTYASGKETTVFRKLNSDGSLLCEKEEPYIREEKDGK